jgi:hypothetical protein
MDEVIEKTVKKIWELGTQALEARRREIAEK